MRALLKGLAVAGAMFALCGFQDKEEKIDPTRAAVIGIWKVDQKIGIALESAKIGVPVDWVLTLNKNGTYVWAVYQPFVEGVGRRHRDMKGAYVVNLEENAIVLKSTEITGKRMALKGILSENRKSFTIPPEDPRREPMIIKFNRVADLPPEVPPTTTGGGI
jgi:hypothetical protein